LKSSFWKAKARLQWSYNQSKATNFVTKGALGRPRRSLNFEARFLLAHLLSCFEICWRRSACKSSFWNSKALCKQVCDEEVVVDLVQGGRCHGAEGGDFQVSLIFWMNLR
jgi:hypothetical protein